MRRQPACTALLHCPRNNPLECPVTGKQLSTRIDAALARTGPPAA